MKNVLFIYLFIFITAGCKTTNYYHGFVLDEQQQPLDSVKIFEDAITKHPQSTMTYKDGYFILYKSPDWTSRLIFKKKGYKTDTIRTVWNRYDGAGKRFLNKIPDTLILRKIE